MHAFNGANDVLCGAVQGITELITNPGVINVDFADVRTVMSKMGMGMMGSGKASGETRAMEAAQAAIASPLLEDVNLSGARGILVNVTGANMSLGEFQDIGAVISEFASEDATVVMGTAIDEMLDEELRVTVVATGLGSPVISKKPEIVAAVPRTKTGDVDYGELDAPAIGRKPKPLASDYDDEILDIPAFLRRQAD